MRIQLGDFTGDEGIGRGWSLVGEGQSARCKAFAKSRKTLSSYGQVRNGDKLQQPKASASGGHCRPWNWLTSVIRPAQIGKLLVQFIESFLVHRENRAPGAGIGYSVDLSGRFAN